jgi:two-component system cell cycle sensor histidine kinase/response regulator CckA
MAIVLPATTDPVAAPVAEPAPAVAPPRSATILIVEDEPALRALTAIFVAEAGYDVLVAGGGEEALALAASTDGPIDLLLTDVVMPGMLGQQLAERLLAGRPTVKVLFISGFARPFLPDPSRSLPGMFLQKPFSDTELIAAIEACLHEDPQGAAG